MSACSSHRIKGGKAAQGQPFLSTHLLERAACASFACGHVNMPTPLHISRREARAGLPALPVPGEKRTARNQKGRGQSTLLFIGLTLAVGLLVAGQSPARDVGEADGDTVEIAGERIRFWDSEAPGLARAASRRRTGRHQAGSASFMLARGH